MKKNTLIILLSLVLVASLVCLKIQYHRHNSVLNSLQNLEFNLAQSNENVERFIRNRYRFLNEQAKNRPDEIRPYFERADKVKNISEKYLAYVENLKRILIGKAPIEEWHT